MSFKEEVKTVINALHESITNENLNENHEIVKQLKELYKKDNRNFLNAVKFGTKKFDRLVVEVLEIPEQPNKNIINYITNGLYEHFHKERIRKIEGSSCSADKSGFIKAMTLKALKENKNLSLYADYKNQERIPVEEWEEQAYWSPTSVKDTDEAIKLFWDWYSLNEY